MKGGLIRADDIVGHMVVRSFLGDREAESGRSTALPTASAPAQRSAVVELMELLALRDAEISGHKEAIAAAYANGEAAGRAAAEDAFLEDGQAALKALEAGIVAARTQLAEALGAFETLALAVAVEVVDKLTEHPDRYRAMLTDMITARAAEVEAAAILSIKVSRSDFPDTRTVATLAASLGSVGDKVKVCDDRDAGNCSIALSLGTLEFGLVPQWEALKALLAGLAQRQTA